MFRRCTWYPLRAVTSLQDSRIEDELGSIDEHGKKRDF